MSDVRKFIERLFLYENKHVPYFMLLPKYVFVTVFNEDWLLLFSQSKARDLSYFSLVTPLAQ